MVFTAESHSSNTRSFEAEVRQVLDLVIHSLYSNKDIFLRELISNASDALDKLRFAALSEKELIGANEELAIKLVIDSDKKRLIIRDNGIGMNEEDLASNLGTIAKSGTKEFINSIKESGSNQDFKESLIGQFGVGFYSAFIVADTVTVLSKKAKEETVNFWQSKGDGFYTLKAATDEDITEFISPYFDTIKQGTVIALDLKDDDEAAAFLKEYQVRSVVKKYSDFIEYPIKLKTENPEKESIEYQLKSIEDKIKDAKDETEKSSAEQEKADLEEKLNNEPEFVFEILNSRKALWAKNKSEISEEDYKEFYRHISHDFNDPLTHIHFNAEGTNEFTALLFIPEKAPFDLFMQEDVKSLQLFINKVFITSESDLLLPKYLRFVKGVVDSSDLPLNVSREMLQENQKVVNIKKNITKKILSTLEKLKNDDKEKYSKFFKELGKVLKEGVHLDYSNKEKLLDLMMFESSTESAGILRTLEEYSDKLNAKTDLDEEVRKHIYVITGENRKELENSPYLEAFKAKDIEVLFLTDPIDEWVIMSAPEFKDKSFKAINKGNIDLGAKEEEKAEQAKKKEEFKDLLSKIQNVLTENISEVRFTDRLVNTLACLVVNEHEMGANLEKIYQSANQKVGKTKRILELNPNHKVIEKLNHSFKNNPEDELIKDYSELIYFQALLLEGSKIENLNRYNELVTNLM
ncbi:MAG: molecular chaperone HtpG [Candidatus Melainabacteria bacterium]|nr:molecular chaperone HtpG [Candidatus Melainabacteria bacterium]